jgi:hypothetical protein
MDLSIVANQEVHVKLAPVDANGAAREVSNIVWTVTSGDATVTADADGLGATIVPSDVPGASVISVSADADLTDAGVNTLTDVVNLTTTAVPVPEATSLGLTADAPTPKA